VFAVYKSDDVTIIILTHGRYNYLERLFESMAKMSSLPARVIVVDSSPGKGKSIKEMTKGLKETKVDYKKIDERVTMTTARNIFLKESNTKLTSFMDDDVYLKEAWLDGVLDGFNRFPEAAGVTEVTVRNRYRGLKETLNLDV
jgi:GT2 family glycosyltransferase